MRGFFIAQKKLIWINSIMDILSPRSVITAIRRKVRRLRPAMVEVLPRLKAITAEETKDTITMWDIYCRWAAASKEEREFANNQIKTLLKTAGLAGVVILPGTPLILPALVKLAKTAGIDILPKWAERGFTNETT